MLSTSSTNTPHPYPGLRPYQPNEQKKFYGRDTDTQALLTKILNQRLTLLFAATGVGKSSLLQAAILPQLTDEQGLSLDAIYYNDWVAPPIKGIQQAVHQSLTKRYGNILADPHTLRLEAFFRLITPGTSQPLVIILDQFEEFFRYRFIHHVADFQPFIDQLAEVILAPELNVSLVFSMREDFALELNAFKPHLPNPLFSNYYRLEKLGIDAAKSAITEPLMRAGYHYEPALLDELLNDLLSRDLTRDASSLAKGTQADSVEPPYLQIVCSQLWELDKQDSAKTLRLATYRKAGGAKGLLENYVNYVLKSFSDREKQVTSKAFDHLISRRGTKMAHTPEDLAELVNLKPSELANVMDKLEKARILRRQQRDQQVWYELYHDMFSGGIEAWNTAWKNHMRLRRSLIGTAASLATLAAIYFGVVGYLQATSTHLRLGNSSTDRVEIYTGTSKFPDPFSQQHYLSETSFERSQLELDKRYPKRDIPDYPLVVRDLIASQPVESRVATYILTGEFCQFSDLLTQALSIDQASPGCTLPTARKRNMKSAANALNAKGVEPNLNPEMDTMQQLMLQQLPTLKTAWGFEQRQALGKTLNYAFSMGMELGNTLSLPVYEPETLLKQAFDQLGSPILDPRQLELLLEWFLNQDPTKTIEHPSSLRPTEVMSTLSDSLKAYANPLLPSVMQTLQLKSRLPALLNSDNPQTREVAISLSALTKDAALIAPVHKLLQDKAPSVRQAALKALFVLDKAQAIPLASTLLTDRNQTLEIRGQLINSLGEIGSLQAAAILLARYQDMNEREEIRLFTAYALGSMGATEALPSFRETLNNPNERTEARTGAIEGIRAMNDTSSIELLLKHLQDNEERLDVRMSCANALGSLNANQAVPVLLTLTEDLATDQNLKFAAIEALSHLEDPSITPRLKAYLKTLPSGGIFAVQITNLLDIIAEPSRNTVSNHQSGKNQLIAEINTSKVPQYEAIHSIQTDSPLDLNFITGSHTQRQALITALNIKDTNRNPALLRLAVDTHNSPTLRAKALAELTPTEEAQALAPALIELTKDPVRMIRIESTFAILRTATGQELLPWLNSTHATQFHLELALARLVETSTRAEAIDQLLNFAQDDNSHLQTKAYELLAQLKATEALDLLEKNLENLENEYQQWRKVRDQAPADLSDELAYETWQENLETSKPAHANLAFHYGYALAQMGSEQALDALNHDLADIRLGASLSLSKYAHASELQAIAKERKQRSHEPLFQQTSYNALNQGLVRLESTTDPQQIQVLETWQAQTKADDASDPVKQRLDWTITLIKHYQQLDQEFAHKYKLKRSLSVY